MIDRDKDAHLSHKRSRGISHERRLMVVELNLELTLLAHKTLQIQKKIYGQGPLSKSMDRLWILPGLSKSCPFKPITSRDESVCFTIL